MLTFSRGHLLGHLLAVVALTGCSGSSETEAESGSPGEGTGVAGDGTPPGESDGGSPVSASELSDLGAEVCAYYERCDLPLMRAYGTGQECIDFYVAGAEYAIELDPRRSTLYREVAECGEIEQTACPTTSSFFDFRPLVRAFLDCTSTPTHALGEACTPGSCSEGLRCSEESDAVCGVCVSGSDNGCSLDVECADTERCDLDSNSCVAYANLGETCSYSGDCASGHCRSGVCDSPGAIGAACEVISDCEPFLLCAEGECRALGGEGDSCEESLGCRYAFTCENNTCVALRGEIPVGGECRYYGCEDGAYCDISEEICKSDAVGEPCTYSCGSQRACIGEVCTERLENGASCSDSDECSSLLCFQGTCEEAPECTVF